MPLLFLLLFALVPALEIYLLVQVGSRIGVLNTLGLLLFLGFVGAAIVKSQGRALALQAQTALSRGELPAGSVMHGMLVIIGGILLIIPGFFTDLLGFLFILPGPRHILVAVLRGYLQRQLKLGRMRVFGAHGGSFSAGFGGFRTTHDPSGAEWTEEARDVSPKVIDVTSVRIDADVDSDGEPKTSTDGGSRGGTSD